MQIARDPTPVEHNEEGGLMANMESRRAVTPAMVLAATLGLAAACWAAATWLMRGMDMGLATRPGSFGFFAAAWVTMMAAMMLPGAAPAVARQARVSGTVRAAVLFTGAYLAIWALAGLVAYGADRPHGPLVAGAVVIAAGAYELTPVKRHFRRRCREDSGTGLGFGLCCVGSSVGLMAMLVALGVMSLLWMAVTAVLACAQKLLPARAAFDVPLALALIGFGLVIAIEPSLIPGLMPPAM
jgi:predicted metal-binding membrane protein